MDASLNLEGGIHFVLAWILLLLWVYPEFCVNVLRECKQQKLV